MRTLSAGPTTQSCVEIYLRIRETSLYRTDIWVQMVSVKTWLTTAEVSSVCVCVCVCVRVSVRACVRVCVLYFAYIVPVSVISWAAVCVSRLDVLSAVAENVPETKFSHALKKWTASVSI